MYRIIIAAGDQERWVAASSLDEARLKAEKLVGDWNCEIKIEQDHDVLDTWFSSALLPLSATAHDPSRYPTNMIESGSDILFFWVAKMAMLCNHLSGKPPFKEINLHAMVNCT
jgi:valyl-tRNA synthetase